MRIGRQETIRTAGWVQGVIGTVVTVVDGIGYSLDVAFRSSYIRDIFTHLNSWLEIKRSFY